MKTETQAEQQGQDLPSRRGEALRDFQQWSDVENWL